MLQLASRHTQKPGRCVAEMSSMQFAEGGEGLRYDVALC